ncbi:putative secreted protein [Granulibacter bethesdensis]|nr:putative secreted protein [Granulibacter bethesdensis]
MWDREKTMDLKRRTLLSLGGLLLLPGCGWHAVYAPGKDGALTPVQEQLRAISVALISDHNGVLLRQALQNRFDYTGGSKLPRYELSVFYTVNNESVGIMPDNSTTRLRMHGIANWTLTADDLKKTILTKGRAYTLDGIDLSNGQFFAMDINSETVLRRMAEELANQITLDLAQYFEKKQADEAIKPVASDSKG